MARQTVEFALDKSLNPVQLLMLGTNVNGSVTGGGAATRITLPTDSVIVRVATDVDVYIVFGDSSVTADSDDALLPGGNVEFFFIKASQGHTHVSVKSPTDSGTVSVTKMV